MGTKEELHGLLDSLPESGLEEVRDLMIVLLREFEDLTEDDAKEFREGEAEVERGEWVWWKDVQREDV